jgi:hypothetical protein
MDSRTLSEFVEKAADRADIHGQLHEYGVSRYWSGVSEERHVEVGTNGSSYWVAVGVGLPAMAEDAEIVWAPVDGYDRAKHLEDQPPPPIVGNADFDSFYLLLGPGADSVAHCGRPKIRRCIHECARVLRTLGAVEQGNEAAEALGLKMLHNCPGVINVRFAAYCRCSADLEA